MASSPTKKIKVEVKSAIRDGFAQRGWRPMRGDSSTFVAPDSVIADPLSLRVPVLLDSYKYGGAVLTANAKLQADEITELLVGFDRESMPSGLTRFPGDEGMRLGLSLDVETAGGLLDPHGNYYKWVVSEQDGVGPAVGEFFAMIDRQLARWAAERDTPAKVLDRYEKADPESALRKNSAAVRTVSTLALLQGRPELARSWIANYQYGLGDDADRFGLFERELAERFPQYGALQRS